MDSGESNDINFRNASPEEIERFLQGLAIGTAPAHRAAVIKRFRRSIDAFRFRAGLIPATEHTLQVEPAVVSAPGPQEFVVTGRNWILTSLFVLTCTPTIVADPDDPPLDELPDDLWEAGMRTIRPDDNGDWTLTLTCDVPAEGIAIAAGDTARSQVAAKVINVGG